MTHIRVTHIDKNKQQIINRNHHNANVSFHSCEQIYVEDFIPERKALTLGGRWGEKKSNTRTILFFISHTLKRKTFTVYTGSEK